MALDITGETVEQSARAVVFEESSGLCEFGKVCSMCDCFADRDGGVMRDGYATATARAALEAAAPAIAAKALRDAAMEVRDYAYRPDDVSAHFPADMQVAYMAGATDAHSVADRLLLARAAAIEAAR